MNPNYPSQAAPQLQPIDSLRPQESFQYDGPASPAPGQPSPTGQMETYNGDPIIDEQAGQAALPRLHLAAYRGDITEVLMCLTDGHDVHSTVVMRNQAGRLVCGITPLFLAAQRGHMKVVKLLVEQGANPAQPAYIQGSADLCTPISVANLNLHFFVARYLKKKVAARKKEDKVLKDEEVGRAATTKEGVPDPAHGAQHVVMANLGDLANWDPSKGDQPELLDGQAMTLLFKHNVDLENWRPDVEITKDGKEQMAVSQSRPVNQEELEALEIVDNQNKLNTFLRDADLSAWSPEQGARVIERGATPSKSTSRLNSGELGATHTSPSVPAQAPAAAIANAGGITPSIGLQRVVPVWQADRAPAPVKYGKGASPSVSPSTGTTPTSAAQQRSSQTRFAQAPRASAAAAAAVAAGRGRRPAPAATRWVAHADSSDEDEADLQVSGSVPAAPPPGMALPA